MTLIQYEVEVRHSNFLLRTPTSFRAWKIREFYVIMPFWVLCHFRFWKKTRILCCHRFLFGSGVSGRCGFGWWYLSRCDHQNPARLRGDHGSSSGHSTGNVCWTIVWMMLNESSKFIAKLPLIHVKIWWNYGVKLWWNLRAN